MAADATTNPVIEDLVRALGERTGCAGLICADTGRPVRWFGEYDRVKSVARSRMLRRVPDEGHPAIVMLADGADAPAGFRFVAMQPLGREQGERYVVFVGGRAHSVRYKGVPTLLRSVTAALRRHIGQFAPPPLNSTRDRPGYGVMVADARVPDAPIQYVNRTLCRATGYNPVEFIGRNARFLQRDDRDQPGRWRLAGALERGEACIASLRNYRRDGTAFEHRIELTPVQGVTGKVTHNVALTFDMTREQGTSAEMPVRDAAALVVALEMSPVGKLVVHGHTGRICFANPAAGAMFGRRADALIGCEMGLLPLVDGPVRLPGPDGVKGGIPVEMTVKPVTWGRHPACLVTLFDVIDQRHVVMSSKGGELGLDRYPYPVVQSRADGSLAWVSQAAADLFGYSREEMLRLSTGALDAGGLVDQEAWARNWDFVRLQRTVTVETRLRRRDGWVLPAVLDVQHVDYAGEETHVVFIRSVQDA